MQLFKKNIKEVFVLEKNYRHKLKEELNLLIKMEKDDGISYFYNLTLKWLASGGREVNPPCSFSKNVFSRERVKRCFSGTFNIIISHIFPENLIEIPWVVQKLWRFTSLSSTFFIRFLDFLTFPCNKETNDITMKQMMSAFFYFQLALNRLFNNCIRL